MKSERLWRTFSEIWERAKKSEKGIVLTYNSRATARTACRRLHQFRNDVEESELGTDLYKDFTVSSPKRNERGQFEIVIKRTDLYNPEIREI